MTREEAIERIEQNKAAAEFYAQMLDKYKSVDHELKDIEAFNMAIEALSAEAVQLVRCKECEHFEYNHVEVVDGVPIIVAHEICRFWSGGSKTSENGYCSFGERRELDDKNTAEDKEL